MVLPDPLTGATISGITGMFDYISGATGVFDHISGGSGAFSIDSSGFFTSGFVSGATGVFDYISGGSGAFSIDSSGFFTSGFVSGTSGWISNAYLGTGLVGSPDLPLTIKSQGGYTTDSSWNSMAIQGSNPATYYTAYFGEDAGGSGYLKLGSAGHPGNLMLSGNSISFEERAVADSAPPATAGFGQIYTKDDHALYFLDGEGVEYTISITPV